MKYARNLRRAFKKSGTDTAPSTHTDEEEKAQQRQKTQITQASPYIPASTRKMSEQRAAQRAARKHSKTSNSNAPKSEGAASSANVENAKIEEISLESTFSSKHVTERLDANLQYGRVVVMLPVACSNSGKSSAFQLLAEHFAANDTVEFVSKGKISTTDLAETAKLVVLVKSSGTVGFD